MLKKIRKFLIFLIGITISQIALADSHKILSSYSELLDSITKGNSVRAIMALHKCTSSANNSIDNNDMLGTLNFTNINKYKIQIGNQQKNVIATSVNMLVEQSKFGTVYNYVRLRIFEDNEAEIFSEYLDPKTFDKLASSSFNCHLSDGKDENGVVIYDLL